MTNAFTPIEILLGITSSSSKSLALYFKASGVPQMLPPPFLVHAVPCAGNAHDRVMCKCIFHVHQNANVKCLAHTLLICECSKALQHHISNSKPSHRRWINRSAKRSY